MIDGVEEIVAVVAWGRTSRLGRKNEGEKGLSLGFGIDRSDPPPWLDSFDTKRKITQVRTVWSSSDGRENAFEPIYIYTKYTDMWN